MPSVHRFLANHRNLATAAVLSASSVYPASDTITPVAGTRQGGARLVLSGAYTGQQDATVDVEVVTADAADLVSAPVFTGVGNGPLTELALTTAAPQPFLITVASTGIVTRAAALNFFGVALEAKAVGAAGNSLTLTVDTTGLTVTAAPWSFLEEANAGDSEFKGVQWDFGGYPLTADGYVDPRTARLRFGDDPQIYRQYKAYTDSQWVYHLDPPLARAVTVGTTVSAVTGGYTVTLTDGTVTETYTGITLYEFLSAMDSRSTLIKVIGVVSDDQTPGGMAVDDLPARTDAYALPAINKGGEALKGVTGVTVAADAPTELLTLSCYDVTVLGAELWTVKGAITTGLRDAETGKAYRDRFYGFTIPQVLPEGSGLQNGRIKVTDFSLDWGESEGGELCIDPLIAGAKAVKKTVKVTLKERPPTDCLCKDADVKGKISLKCLGLTVSEGGGMTLDPEYQSRLAALYSWRAEFMRANTRVDDAAVSAVFYDLELCDQITAEFASALAEIYLEAAARTAWDTALTTMQADVASLLTMGLENTTSPPPSAPEPYQVAKLYTLGDRILHNGFAWRLLSITGVSAYTVAPDSIPGTAYVSVHSATSGTPYFHGWETYTDTASTTSEQYTPTGAEGVFQRQFPITKLHWTWVMETNPPMEIPPATLGDILTEDGLTDFVRRYQAIMDYVRAVAGVVPKGSASGPGGGCWQEYDDATYWQVNGGEFLPAFFNRPYHSCVKTIDSKGVEGVLSTQEFGMIIRCKCPERLKAGSSFTIEIDADAAPPKTYVIGDQIQIPIIAATPLAWQGGVNGNDTLTWTVRGAAGSTWPDYAAPIHAEPLYDQAGLQFRIVSGGIPFAVGDQFSFAATGGTWRWRRDAGAWSAPAAIDLTPQPLADGLTATFMPGPYPAFVAGDRWGFVVQQPHALIGATVPSRALWRWAGETATATLTFSVDQPLTALALWHTLPATAEITVQGVDATDTVLWTVTPDWTPTIILALLEGTTAVAACRKLTVTVTQAAAGAIRWLWAGVPWTPDAGANHLSLNRQYSLLRGVDQARFIGGGHAGEIAWTADTRGSWLEAPDLAELLAMLDHVKTHHDEPMLFIPNRDVPESFLVKVNTDAVTLTDVSEFQYSPRRVISATLPLAAVLN